MKTSKQYDTLIAISIIRLSLGTHNVMDLKILQEHAAALIDDDKNLKTLYKMHSPSKA